MAHMSWCSQLYVRLCSLVPHVAEYLSEALHGMVVVQCDLLFCVQVGGVLYWGAVVPKSLFFRFS